MRIYWNPDNYKSEYLLQLLRSCEEIFKKLIKATSVCFSGKMMKMNDHFRNDDVIIMQTLPSQLRFSFQTLLGFLLAKFGVRVLGRSTQDVFKSLLQFCHLFFWGCIICCKVILICADSFSSKQQFISDLRTNEKRSSWATFLSSKKKIKDDLRPKNIPVLFWSSFLCDLLCRR